MAERVIEVLSVEPLLATLTPKSNGLPVDPTGFVVQMAVVPETHTIALTDFVTATWVTDNETLPVRYKVKAVVGKSGASPAPDIVIAKGRYKVYTRVIGSGQDPMQFHEYVNFTLGADETVVLDDGIIPSVGPGGPSVGSFKMDDLADVNMTGVTDGQVPTFQSSSSTYVPTTPSGGGTTDEHIEDVVAGFLTPGTNIAIAYDDPNNLFTISAPNVQPLDSDLTAIAALSTTTFGRALLTLADAAGGRSYLGLGTAAVSNTGDFDAAGAAAAAQAFAIARANHTGTQSADTLTDGTTNKAFLATERTKLAGIATGATANSSDAVLEARANHTGTQLLATISDAGTIASRSAPAGTVVGTTDTQTLTNKSIDASEVNSGVLAIARIATGTPNGSKFVRDDGTLATPSGTGAVASDTIWDAKGDLAGGTGADTAAKLTVGANDTMLIADSAQATGLKWGTPSTVKTALSLNNVPNTDMTNVANAASGVLAIARGGTAQGTAAAARGASGLNLESVTTFSNADVVVVATDRAVMQIGTLSAPRVATLPAASAVAAGYWLVVGDASGSVTTTNTITVTRAGSDTINGATTVVIGSPYGARRLVSDGTSTWTFDGGVLRASQNLSDLQSTATAKTNLSLNNVDNTSNATERAATRTLTNARITKRVVVVNAPGATPSINSDNNDIARFTGLAAAITSMTTNLTGTPVDGDSMVVEFIDNGTARAITWGTSFASTTVTLPTTTVISTRLRCAFMWNTTTTKWDLVGVA